MKRKYSRVWKAVWVLLLLVPLLLLSFLQTMPGKRLLASGLSTVLSRSENLEVRIGKISGWIPADVNLETVEIGDAHGIWFSARELHCRWVIRELKDRRIRLREIAAEEMILHRFPKSGKIEPFKSKTPSGFQPLEFRLDGMTVERLRLARGMAGISLDYAVHSGGISFLTSGQLTGELLVSGDAEGRVELDAQLTGSPDDRLKIKAELENLRKPTFGLDHLSGRGEATIGQGGVDAVITVDLEEGGQSGRMASRLHYENRKLGLQQFQFSGPDFSVVGDLSLGFSSGWIDVALNSSFMDSTTNHYDVRGTATVATSNKTWGVDVQSLEIRGWDAVSFTLSGEIDPEQVALSGALKPFDVGDLSLVGMSNFTGAVTGEITLFGPLKEPQVVAGLHVAGFSSVQEVLDELPELGFSIYGGVRDGALFGATVLTNYASGHFAADLSMPCDFSLSPIRYNPEPRNLQAEVDADLDLGIFNQLSLFQSQLIQGMLKTKLSYSAQQLAGYLKVENGRYEHYDLGMVLRDFNAELAAVGDGFVVRQASATDGDSGSVELSGGFGLGGIALQVDLARAGIIQRDEIEAEVSGSLRIDGRASRPDISGVLTIDRAYILLDNIVPDPPPLLTDFDRRDTYRAEAVDRKEYTPSPVGLDVRIDMPDQVFMNAAMIEAVMGGQLHITDVPRGISVRGKIKPRRGFVSFVGKKFRFTTGDILLDGSIPSVAILDNLTAEYSRADVTARLILNGRADDPHFRLESTPPMPKDEVLSHVLFGRDSSSISPYQAYQIAAAARQLSEGMTGPGFMYQVRQAVGVDTLEWREAEVAGEASSVAAGKYIASGLYIEINRSLDSGAQTGMMAEFEVSRHFSIETYTGPKMRPGIGVNWRNDY